MTLHLIEMPIALKDLHQWAAGRNLGRGVFDEGLALHHLLGEIFGPAVLQPFRLMLAPRAKHGTLYAYAGADASELRTSARQSLTPSLDEVVPLDRMRSISRPETAWTAGQRLGFDVRLRPVVRLANAMSGTTASGEAVRFAKGAEIDAFLARSMRQESASREAVYIDWLAARLAPVAELEPDASRLTSFRRLSVTRKGRSLEGPDAAVHGTLRIVDPLGFADRLARGVGRHRAYGFGMLLLRPPQRTAPC
ncbi:type I-E CRISPR-associated protein Cas6/Cse3/CasE [Salipiger sp.]|uniref:type I-E CRISPR-associated protein Cas6/Cse3/CasE n=1 Tax=Salipiger sp. TaxID=2078585 RepID=UPI003A977B41